MRVPPEEFEALVEKALDGLPEEIAELLENVVVVVEEEPDPEDLEALEMAPEDELFGLYQGVPQTERGTSYLAPSPTGWRSTAAPSSATAPTGARSSARSATPSSTSSDTTSGWTRTTCRTSAFSRCYRAGRAYSYTSASGGCAFTAC